MIKHFVAFRFKPDAEEERINFVLSELADFPARFPTMRRWSLGRNVSTRDRTFSHAFAVEFASHQDLVDYLASDAHERFVAETWRPVIEARAIVSLELPDV